MALGVLSACTVYRDDGVHGGSRQAGANGEGSAWNESGAPSPGGHTGLAPGAGPTASFDRWKELLVIDRTVLDDPRAKNESDGPLGFRHLVEETVGAASAPDVVRAWLDTWAESSSGAAARSGVTRELVCPWLRASPANGCDATCTYCAAERLDLGRAPFELIAVVNRVDLATEDEDEEVCSADAGELRLVYTAVRPGTRTPLPFTVIFEYEVRADPRDGAPAWAKAWHALGDLPFGDRYTSALAALTKRVTDHGARDGGVSALAQVRTNETAFGAPWEMREFALTGASPSSLRLAPRSLSGTPRLDMNEASALTDFIRSNRKDIVTRGMNGLPRALWAPAAPIPSATFRWRAPDLRDDEAERAFSANTCSGCHGGERPTDRLLFQHLAAPSAGYYGTSAGTQVSRYLNDPGGADELSRRERAMRRLLDVTCGGGGQGGGAPPDAGPYAARVEPASAAMIARVRRAH